MTEMTQQVKSSVNRVYKETGQHIMNFFPQIFCHQNVQLAGLKKIQILLASKNMFKQPFNKKKLKFWKE